MVDALNIKVQIVENKTFFYKSVQLPQKNILLVNHRPKRMHEKYASQLLGCHSNAPSEPKATFYINKKVS